MTSSHNQHDTTSGSAGKPARVIARRYEVVKALGEGASARTLLCMDLQENRQVAVKELHFARLGDWKYLELFEREARTLAMLRHPGIPQVFDYFESDAEDGNATFCIVQEFVDGPSILQRMQSGPMLGQQEVLELTSGVLDVLDYLHGRAPPVIHRDIKPSNILLRADGTPVLIDFGGVNVGWRPPDAAGTTIIGTVGYMPPEQFVGQAGPASDMYSLGATLLHIVTGRSPSEFSFDTGRIEVPDGLPIDPALVRLIEALLRPAPRDRPRSASAARAILAGRGHDPMSGSHALAPGLSAEHVALAAAARRNVQLAPASAPPYALTGISGEPRFVDMGEPPRDPKGELKDVYRNLMHPLFPARRAWADATHIAWMTFYGIGTVVTLGGVPVMYAMGRRKRGRMYDNLFQHGVFTTGAIRFMSPSDGFYTTIRYEFEAAGMLYVGTIKYAQEMTQYWSTHDTVAVLYDPDDPNRSCVVYR